MATLTSYTYEKAVNSDSLTLEIQKDALITIALAHIDTLDGTVTIWFRDSLPTDDKTELDAVVAAHADAPPPEIQDPKNSDNVPIFEPALRIGNENSTSFTIVSPDFTDRTSWYQASVQVTGGALTDLGIGLTFQAASGVRNWVNMKSSKLTLDYKKVLERDGSLTASSMRYITVFVDGVAAALTDYTVDFANGIVTFTTSKSGSTVTANYWHNDVPNASEFLINPPPGYKYIIEHVELQFSQNMSFTDSIAFEIWAGASLSDYSDFNKTLFDAGYGQSRTKYRNMGDLINWCNNEYPPIPACGDFTQPILVFPFKFLQSPVIDSQFGTLIRLCTSVNGTLTGEMATATLYMLLVKIT